MDLLHFSKGYAGMSITFRFHDPLVVVTPYGVNSLEEVCGIFEEIIEEPGFKPPAKILFDARHTDYGPPSEELEMLSEFLGKLDAYRDSRWAIVASTNTLVYGLTRMFCCLAESQGICAEPFSNFDEACQWLLDPHLHHHNREYLPEKMSSPVRT